jgi:hypothetical protein
MICFWWPLSRLGLCLGGVDEPELARLLTQRTRWIAVFGGAAAFSFVLGVQMTQQPFGTIASGAAFFAGAGVFLLICVGTWQYSRVMVRRARGDRERDPRVCKGSVRRLLLAPDGGCPVLIRTDNRRRLWLTGSRESLKTVVGRLTTHVRGRPFQLVVVLTYYPRCRVIREVNGMAVESLEQAVVELSQAAMDHG